MPEEKTPTAPGNPSRGAQVVLAGEAQTAARGGVGGDIETNTLHKRALEARGEQADGSTPDGSTLTGEPPPDVVVREVEPLAESSANADAAPAPDAEKAETKASSKKTTSKKD